MFQNKNLDGYAVRTNEFIDVAFLSMLRSRGLTETI